MAPSTSHLHSPVSVKLFIYLFICPKTFFFHTLTMIPPNKESMNTWHPFGKDPIFPPHCFPCSRCTRLMLWKLNADLHNWSDELRCWRNSNVETNSFWLLGLKDSDSNEFYCSFFLKHRADRIHRHPRHKLPYTLFVMAVWISEAFAINLKFQNIVII